MLTAAVYIQKKYASNNPLLKSFFALDPRIQSSLTHGNLLNLKQYFETFLLPSCCGEYSPEIEKFVTDSELPLPEEKARLDVW